jgi:HAD superfamily hydrolase (TIGR01484 family)
MLALSDIDGTLNNEHVPESERIHTIGPAREAIETLQRCGVPVGICTARAQGEAELYAEAVGARGWLISENGACTTSPQGERVTIGDMREIRECVTAIEARLGRPLVTTLDLHALEGSWRQQMAARREGREVFPPSHENDLGHSTVEALRVSAARVASAYISGLTLGERSIAIAIAEAYGFRPFGDLLHLINRRADKGVALDGLCESLRAQEVSARDASGVRKSVRIDRVTPIVFGNGENDLPLFASAIERGGYGVLVADPVRDCGFHFDIQKRPPHDKTVVTYGAPFGYGMKAALSVLAFRVRDEYGITLER